MHHIGGNQLPRSLSKVSHPPPAALDGLRGVRRELVRLYREAKMGLHDPQIVGRLAHILSIMAGVTKDHEFEQRLDALEQAAGITPSKPNGSGRAHQELRR
jgi:hypothetical protein